MASGNLDGCVELVAGVRIAGLGGISRGRIWIPPEQPKYDSYADWFRASKQRHCEVDVSLAEEARTHRSTIFWDTYARLWDQEADVLVSHEAPSIHPHRFAVIDDPARAMGVKATFHGHHHDSADDSDEWDRIGVKAYGVGFCGITDLYGGVVRPGDFDERGRGLMNESETFEVRAKAIAIAPRVPTSYNALPRPSSAARDHATHTRGNA